MSDNVKCGIIIAAGFSLAISGIVGLAMLESEMSWFIKVCIMLCDCALWIGAGALFGKAADI